LREVDVLLKTDAERFDCFTFVEISYLRMLSMTSHIKRLISGVLYKLGNPSF